MFASLSRAMICLSWKLNSVSDRREWIVEHRMRRTLDLYKYDLTGKGLMEWAMAQTGMDDPLTRFNRTELEVYFKQYSFLLKQHLSKLLSEMYEDKTSLNRLLAEAPEGARRAVAKMS